MTRLPADSPNGDKVLASLLRRAREPFVSQVESAGFALAIEATVRAARHIIEANPSEFGLIAAPGTRDEGTIWYAGQDAENARSSLGYDHREIPDGRVALVPARVFTVVAYRHPFFDGNKRTGFLAAALVGYALGFGIKAIPYHVVEQEVLNLTAREAPDEDVAAWLLGNLFIPPGKEVP